MADPVMVGPYKIAWNCKTFQAILNGEVVKEDVIGKVVWDWCNEQVKEKKDESKTISKIIT